MCEVISWVEIIHRQCEDEGKEREGKRNKGPGLSLTCNIAYLLVREKAQGSEGAVSQSRGKLEECGV